MAYTWTTGETITAEKLNNTGGSSYDLVITADTYPLSSSTTFSVLSGSSTAVYNKLVNGDPTVKVVLICDLTSAQFPGAYVFPACRIGTFSDEGVIVCDFFDMYDNSLIALDVEPDGSVYRD